MNYDNTVKQRPSHNNLLYEYEVLWARYKIREHYLKVAVKDIYENIGQSLLHIQIQLSMLAYVDNLETKIEESLDLTSQVIKELRYMGFCLDTEKVLLAEASIIRALDYELKRMTQRKPELKVRGNAKALSPGKEFIVFRMLQEILISIYKQNNLNSLDIKIIFGKETVSFILNYTGPPTDMSTQGSDTNEIFESSRLNLKKRAYLIGGTLNTKCRKSNETKIILTVPIESS